MSARKSTDDDEAVVFNREAYSVVASWLSKGAVEEEEEEVAPKHKKPLYAKSQPLQDEDKFLASKILKKKKYEEPVKRPLNDADDEDDEDDSFKLKGQQNAKKPKTLSVQEQLLQSLRMQQEKRKQKNNKKKNKKQSQP